MNKQHVGLIILLLLFGNLAAQKYESDYIEEINKYFDGSRESPVPSGRVDILTKQYAIEVEFADKWKNSIGQSLWYGLQTNKTPGIVLIREEIQQNRYVIQLGAALDYAGLSGKIKVWIYPDDFKNMDISLPNALYKATTTAPLNSNKTYWLTTSSKIRHNSTCQYFNRSRGEFCEKNKGIACKKCGG